MGAGVGYGCRVGRTVPRPTRDSSRVAASVRLVGSMFHSLMVLGKKDFLYCMLTLWQLVGRDVADLWCACHWVVLYYQCRFPPNPAGSCRALSVCRTAYSAGEFPNLDQ